MNRKKGLCFTFIILFGYAGTLSAQNLNHKDSMRLLAAVNYIIKKGDFKQGDTLMLRYNVRQDRDSGWYHGMVIPQSWIDSASKKYGTKVKLMSDNNCYCRVHQLSIGTDSQIYWSTSSDNINGAGFYIFRQLLLSARRHGRFKVRRAVTISHGISF